MGTILPDGKKFYSAASQIGSKDKTVAWYEHTLSNLPEDARELLENYSQIAPADIENHVLTMVRNITHVVFNIVKDGN